MFGRTGGNLQGWCRPCFRAYHRTHTEQARLTRLQRIEIAREFVLEHLRSHPCKDCGEASPTVLEFDHVETKQAGVSMLVSRGVPLARLAQEIDRCEVVCVNCHRRRSAQRLPPSSRRSARPTSRPLRQRNLRIVRDHLLKTACVDCQENDPLVLDFDHVDDKQASVSRLAHSECSLARLEAEMAKCVVRCANCHRRKTAADFGHYRHRSGEAA
jgi:hypothetical protein